MEIQTTLQPHGIAIVRLVGRIDAHTAQTLKDRLSEMIDAGNCYLVLDLGAVTFLDSTGLGALVNSLKRAEAAGGDLRRAQVPQAVRKILELTSLQSRLARYATIPDALATYPKGAQ
ncbi:MAG TPA: STAS domain-containing protein [Roseiflexaceae bacterium]|nr:STAS domain-containing protein [Roseiflexaceae bacterium]